MTELQPLATPPVAPAEPAAGKPRQRKRRRKLLLIAAAVLVLLVALLARPQPTHYWNVHGVIELANAQSFRTAGDQCSGVDGNRGLHVGAVVIVADGDPPPLPLAHGLVTASNLSSGGCDLTFEVDRVPAGKSSYHITVSGKYVLRFAPEKRLKSDPVLKIVV